ncbi:MAG: hypothetical protein ACI9ES_002403 [Oceanospirillaceae bacterium]|jgi:hypothetical protein
MEFSTKFGNSVNVIVMFFCINLYLIIIFGSGTFSIGVFEDEGAISITTILLLMLAQFIVLLEAASAKNKRHTIDWLLLAFVLQIYFMREADFHRVFTEINITQGRFYSDPSSPLMAKIIAGSFLVCFLFAFVYLGIKYFKPLLSAFLQVKPWAISSALWFGLLFLSQLLDKSAFNSSEDLRLKNIEEMLEFSAAVYLLMAVCLWRSHKHTEIS